MPMCPIHKKEMRQNSRGWYCTGKMEDGSWCAYKPSATPNPVNRTAPVQPVYQSVSQKQPSDWERKVGKQKALCGMVNGLFAGGMKPSEVTAEVVLKLSSILSQIETASGVPATPVVKSVQASPTEAVPPPTDEDAPIDVAGIDF